MPKRKRLLLLAATLTLLVAGVVCTLDWSAAPAELQLPPEPVTAERAAAPEANDSRLAPPDPSAERRSPEPRPAPEVPRSRMAFVRGRCVAAETGAPIEGCSLFLRPRGRLSASTPPPRVGSGADGRFELACLPAFAAQAAIIVSAEGRGDSELRLGSLKAGQDIELGDLRLRIARRVQGHVVDDQDEPVPGIRLSLAGGLGSLLSFASQADSGTAGAFSFPESIPEGVWSLAVTRIRPDDDPRLDFVPILLEPERVVVRASGAEPDLRVRIHRGRPIRGSVMGDKDRMVKGAQVRAVAGPWLGPRVATDMLGDFVLLPAKGVPPAVRLDVAPGGLYEGLRTTEEFAWGAEDVRLTVRKAAVHSVTVAVVEKGTGMPVRGFRVRVEPDDGNPFRLLAEATCSDRSGQVEVSGIRPGRNVAKVFTYDGSFVAVEVPFVASDATPALRIEVERAVAIPVRVVSRDSAQTLVPGVRFGARADGEKFEGRPWDAAIGARVYLLSAGGGMAVRSPNDFLAPAESESIRRDPGLLARVVDEKTVPPAGLATLHAPPGSGPFSIRAVGQHGGVAQIDGIEPIPRSEPLTLVLLQGATLEGTLRPASVAARAVICLRKPGEDRASMVRRWSLPDQRGREPRQELQAPARQSADWGRVSFARAQSGSPDGPLVGPGGSFELTGLAEGMWEVAVAIDGAVHDAALATVQLVAGQKTRVDLDARSLAPGRIRGRIVFGAAAAGAGELILAGELSRGSWLRWKIQTDEAGAFVAEDVPPGRYQVKVMLGSSGDVQSMTCAGSLESCMVAAGSDVDQVFSLETRRLEVRLVGEDGRPAARRMCLVTTPPQMNLFRLSDDDGRLVVGQVPGTMQVWVQPDWRYVGEVVLERAEQSVELKVPAATAKGR